MTYTATSHQGAISCHVVHLYIQSMFRKAFARLSVSYLTLVPELSGGAGGIEPPLAAAPIAAAPLESAPLPRQRALIGLKIKHFLLFLKNY